MVRAIILFLCRKILRKEEQEMVAIYVALIIKGKRTYAQVPAKLKEPVKQMLIDLELEELVQE